MQTRCRRKCYCSSSMSRCALGSMPRAESSSPSRSPSLAVRGGQTLPPVLQQMNHGRLPRRDCACELSLAMRGMRIDMLIGSCVSRRVGPRISPWPSLLAAGRRSGASLAAGAIGPSYARRSTLDSGVSCCDCASLASPEIHCRGTKCGEVAKVACLESHRSIHGDPLLHETSRCRCHRSRCNCLSTACLCFTCIIIRTPPLRLNARHSMQLFPLFLYDLIDARCLPARHIPVISQVDASSALVRAASCLHQTCSHLVRTCKALHAQSLRRLPSKVLQSRSTHD